MEIRVFYTQTCQRTDTSLGELGEESWGEQNDGGLMKEKKGNESQKE